METSVGDPNLSAVVQPLVRTVPWVRFIAILNFIGVGLMLLVSIPAIFLNIEGMGAGAPAGTGGVFKLVGLFYLVLAGLYVLPAVLAWRYARAISHFATVSSAAQLVVAMDAQRRVWMFWAILLGIGLVFGVLGAVVGVIAALAGRTAGLGGP